MSTISPGTTNGTNTTSPSTLATAMPSAPASVMVTCSSNGNSLFLLPIVLIFCLIKQKKKYPLILLFSLQRRTSLHDVWRSCLSFVGNGQSLSAFSTTCGQHFSTVGGRHSLAETVLVCSLSQGRLECSFHFSAIFFVSFFVKILIQKYALFPSRFFEIEFAKVHNFFELLIKNYFRKIFFVCKVLFVNCKYVKNKFFFFCLKKYLYICKSIFQSKKMLNGTNFEQLD